MSELTRLTLKDAVEGLRAKRFSSAEITSAHLAAIENARPLNAFVLETPEKALAMAAQADARIASGVGCNSTLQPFFAKYASASGDRCTLPIWPEPRMSCSHPFSKTNFASSFERTCEVP